MHPKWLLLSFCYVVCPVATPSLSLFLSLFLSVWRFSLHTTAENTTIHPPPTLASFNHRLHYHHSTLLKP
ncbi:hypothetical protein VNO80_07542 [Phaseolus coccineus]|uniref:Uncharacterized protein n=1 Tax=Phaseolus coccineus TaxID=3886 RepID=A0AAN9NJH5_PHACN